MLSFALSRARSRGQVSIEAMIVLVPWFLVIMLIFNLMLILSSMMINQSTINRAAQQVSSTGCLPVAQVKDELESHAFFGMHDVEVRAITPTIEDQARTDFERERYLDEDGDLKTSYGVSRSIPDCSGSPLRHEEVPSGDYIFVQASYTQDIFLLSLLGIDASYTVHRNALTVSNSLEYRS